MSHCRWVERRLIHQDNFRLVRQSSRQTQPSVAVHPIAYARAREVDLLARSQDQQSQDGALRSQVVPARVSFLVVNGTE